MDIPLSPARLVHCEWRLRQVYLVLSDRVDLVEEVRLFGRCMAASVYRIGTERTVLWT
jgi:hypothetical protein